MDAAVWTAIGLLTTFSVGTLFFRGSRIDSLAARMDTRFDSMERHFEMVDSRFDVLIARMESRFDSVDARLDAVNARIDTHLDRHAG